MGGVNLKFFGCAPYGDMLRLRLVDMVEDEMHANSGAAGAASNAGVCDGDMEVDDENRGEDLDKYPELSEEELLRQFEEQVAQRHVCILRSSCYPVLLVHAGRDGSSGERRMMQQQLGAAAAAMHAVLQQRNSARPGVQACSTNQLFGSATRQSY